jgi:hypothetical protein
MNKRPSLTIAVVTATRLMRADFDTQTDGPVQVWSGLRPAGGRMIAEAVSTTLALGGGRPAARVLVLCEDLWCQSVTLPAAQTDGLSPHETAQALQFEVEPFSNLAPSESVVGHRVSPQSGGTRLYWVVECSRSDLAAIRDVVSKAGGRLIGVSHPGGLPMPVGDVVSRQPWHRVEQWSRGMLLVRSPSGAADQVSIQSATPAQLEGLHIPPSEYGESLAADAEDSLVRRWLCAWAACLARQSAGLAILAPAPAVVPIRRLMLAGIGFELLAAAACFACGRWAAAYRAGLRREVVEVRASVGQIMQIEKENADAVRALVDLRQGKDVGEGGGRVLELRRRALPSLLRALAQARPRDVVIQELRDEGRWSLLVSGIGMSAGVVDELTLGLTRQLRGTGWTVHPMQKVALGVFDNAGPWRFTLQVAMADSLMTAERAVRAVPVAAPAEGEVP